LKIRAARLTNGAIAAADREKSTGKRILEISPTFASWLRSGKSGGGTRISSCEFDEGS
jgi:hypothetical protein